jgi:hypothetical protein
VEWWSLSYKIVACEHFSLLFHKINDEKDVEMQVTIKKSQGVILKDNNNNNFKSLP